MQRTQITTKYQNSNISLRHKLDFRENIAPTFLQLVDLRLKNSEQQISIVLIHRVLRISSSTWQIVRSVISGNIYSIDTVHTGPSINGVHNTLQGDLLMLISFAMRSLSIICSYHMSLVRQNQLKPGYAQWGKKNHRFAFIILYFYATAISQTFSLKLLFQIKEYKIDSQFLKSR